MSVLRVEEYGNVLKVVLKPTKTFPVGYFYTDNNSIARELIESYTWCLHKKSKNICVVTFTGTHNTGLKILRFHQEYAFRLLNYYPDYIDHINGLEIDNRNENLNEVTNQQNARNRPSIGYHFVAKGNNFQPICKLNDKLLNRGSFHTEPEALLATYQLREEIYSDYNYNFLEDRRDFNFLLSQELEGTISHDKATYQRVKMLVTSNPWYVYRYNLFEYCKQNNIVISSFSLDSQGFMINPVTKQRLCPY